VVILVKKEDIPEHHIYITDLTTKLRTFILLEIDPGQGILRNSDLEGYRYNKTTTNVDTLAVLVIETGDTPKIDIRGLSKDLKENGLEVRDDNPWAPEEVRGGDASSEDLLYKTHRPWRIHMWPSFLWIVRSPRITRTESQDDSPKKGNYILAHKTLQEHDPLLGQLGIAPPRLNRHLNTLGISEHYTSPDNMKMINKIILDASLEAYKRYESWKRRKKYRLD